MKTQLKWVSKDKNHRIYLNTTATFTIGTVEHEADLDFGYIVYSNKEYDYSNVKSQAIKTYSNASDFVLNLDVEQLKAKLEKDAEVKNCKIYDLAMTNYSVEL